MVVRTPRARFIVLLVAVGFGVVFAVVNAAAQTAQPAGAAKIDGIVVSDAGAPMKGVRVRLMSVPPLAEMSAPGDRTNVTGVPGEPASSEAETDEAGRFQFSRLTAGRYLLRVAASPGVTVAPQQQLLDLDEGQAAGIRIRINRPGSIAGRVVGDTGPLAGAQVRLLRWGGPAGGPKRLVPALLGPVLRFTDSSGRYRIIDVPPGEYYLVASYAAPHAPGDFSSRHGYVPAFFPGSPLRKDAQPIVVRPGEETAGVDVRLAPVNLGSVSGKAVDAEGAALPQPPLASFSLVPASDARAAPTTLGAVQFAIRNGRQTSGTFLFRDVPPGDYYVVAALLTPTDPGNGQPPRVRVSDGRALWTKEGAYAPVTVKEGSEVSVNLRTNAGATISGRVAIEGGTGTAQPAVQPIIYARTVGPALGTSLPAVGLDRATVGPDGVFQLAGVRGPIVLSAQGERLALTSITRAGEDLAGKTMEFKGTERMTDVVVTMTRDTARLKGQVTTGAAGTAMVIVFPEDAKRWPAGAPFVRVARVAAQADAATTRTGGQEAPAGAAAPFTLSALAPGRYLAAAIDDPGEVAPIDPASLERLRPSATAITLAAGETGTVALKIVR